MRERRPERVSGRWAWVLAPLVIIIGWQLLASTDRWSPALLPSPMDTFDAFGRMWSSGQLMENAAASMRRVLAGIVIGTTAGVVVGLGASGRHMSSATLRHVVELFRPIPPIAWIPLAIAWFGVGFGGSVAVVVIGVFFPFAIACSDAIERAREAIAAPVAMYGLDRRQAIRIGFPAALPEIATAFRLAVGFGWTSVVASELVSARAGLGYVIQESRLLLQMDRVVVAMATIGVIGFALTRVTAVVEGALVRWLRPDLVPARTSHT